MSKDCSSGVLKAWEATVRKTQAAKKRANSIFGTMSVSHAEDEDASTSTITNMIMATATTQEESFNNNNTNTRKNGGTGEVYHAERVLSNGDYYTGHWSDNFPHGHGKYLWTDGCMYVGEWFRGKTMGKGRFSWPSGATYEGEFKSGYMDGKGTYTSSNGDTYKGCWVMNLKHGHGLKSYANGDYYDGEWRRGMQEGNGKYQWKKNGNYYIGEWKNGEICGKGTFIWSNSGNRYDGYWEDGWPKGHGTFRWNDGSFYMGNWSKDPNEQNGTYYPSGASQDANLEWDPQDVFNVDLDDCKVCPGEKVSVLPSQKKLAVWRSSKGGSASASASAAAAADSGGVRPAPRRMSVDGRISVPNVDRPPFDRINMLMGASDGAADAASNYDNAAVDDDGGSNNSVVEIRDSSEDVDLMGLKMEDVEMMIGKVTFQQQPLKIPRTVKRQGVTISKGHKNYELMLNLQLGIRHSVGRPAPAISLDLKASAFDPKEKVWTKFPPEGSKYTPPHQSCEFKWKDYCPVVFRTLRKLFKVDPADYMISICGDDALRELSSPGKSGSFFYLTNDDRYMIKTMKKSEVKVLIRMLSAYYNHVRAFENTLVTKYYGLHCVKLTGPIQKKVRFIIMGNLFCSEYTIHRRYDLKGSSHGRTTDKLDADMDATTILKDLDLNFIFRLQKSWYQEFRRQIDRDSDFLEQERIMDYSLLVGLHFMESSASGDLIPSGSSWTPTGELDSEGSSRLSIADVDHLLLDPTRWASIRLGLNMPARAERTIRRNDFDAQLIGEPSGEFYDVVMFFGIIDILQDYDISKKLEHAYKSIQYDATSISAVDPRQYSKRFRDFIYNAFVEET